MLLEGNNGNGGVDKVIVDLPVETAQQVGTEFTDVNNKIKALEDEIELLKKSVRLAKGTKDVGQEAAEALRQARQGAEPVTPVSVVETKPLTLAEQIEQILRREFMTTEQLSRAVGASVSKVSEALKSARPKVINLGSVDRPRWSWRVGSTAKPSELRNLIERLISYEPMEFRQIVNATGAREGLVQGHMVEIRKARKDVYDMGTPGRARWFILPETARPAHLERKRGNGKKGNGQKGGAE